MKDLCLSLAYADTEAEIIQILKDESYWDSLGDWKPFGGMENSFSIIGNQQSLPESAFVEKIINSIDAVLMAECLKKGINPESDLAPKSIWTAAEEYFGIKNGFLYNLTARERGELAEKTINVIASGSRAVPCYTFIDFGEGQSAKTMPNTLLSLAKSNKYRIPFVQGKFNMGGTGVLLFCGEKNIQVIISKRDPQVAVHEKHDSTINDWSFTVVRREDPREGQKHSTFNYLAPNNQILNFKSPALPLFPGPYPEPFYKDIEHCTFIKLIEYQIPTYKTNITLDMYNRLNCLLPRLALPVRLWERRKGWGEGTHTFETTLSGLSVRLEEDTRGMLELRSSSTFYVNGTTMPTTIYAFKKEEQADRYRSDEGVIFVQNGQTQGNLSKIFFKRKKVGLDRLPGILLLEVDCDQLDGRSREKLFMNSRDRLRQGQLKKDIEDQLETLVREHPGLRELNTRKRAEEIKERLSQSKPLENVLAKIVKNNPILAKILGTGSKITSPFKKEEAEVSQEFKGKMFPTYFSLRKGKSYEYVKDAYIGQRCRVQFNTDAEDNYFKRDIDPGVLTVYCDGDKYTCAIVNLWNGVATLNMELPNNAEVNDEYDFLVQITDPSRIAPFENHFKVVVKGEAKSHIQSEGGTRVPPMGKGEGKGNMPGTMGVPDIYPVKEEDWPTYNFDQESGVAVRHKSEDEYEFFINVDNVFLKTEQKISKADPDLLESQFTNGLALIALAALNEFEKQSDFEKEQSGEIDVQLEIFKLTKAISPFILPIIRDLGSLSYD